MKKITEYRHAHGFSLARFAEEIGIASAGYLHDIESGRKRASPFLATRIEVVTKGEIKRDEIRPDIFAPPSLQGAQTMAEAE